MKAKAKTAGKTAKKNNTTAKKWREVRTARGMALKSPGGRLYYGTPAEVRDAALMPWRRDALAQSLQFYRRCHNAGVIDAARFAMVCAVERRDAIKFGRADLKSGACVTIPADVFIKIAAGSRLVRDDFDGYLDDLFAAEVSALLDVAQSETGKREIPLTRHERAALARCGAGRSDAVWMATA